MSLVDIEIPMLDELLARDRLVMVRGLNGRLGSKLEIGTADLFGPRWLRFDVHGEGASLIREEDDVHGVQTLAVVDLETNDVLGFATFDLDRPESHLEVLCGMSSIRVESAQGGTCRVVPSGLHEQQMKPMERVLGDDEQWTFADLPLGHYRVFLEEGGHELASKDVQLRGDVAVVRF